MAKHNKSLPWVGADTDRVDGRAKVTGQAKYAAEYKPEGLTYGVFVTSTIARGKILTIDSRKAEQVPGVLLVMSHLNRVEVPGWKESADKMQARVAGQEFRLFNDDRIYYNHQPVALVIADTIERANEAATLVKVTYSKEPARTDLKNARDRAFKPRRSEDYVRGNINQNDDAPVKISAEYSTPFQVHLPMEMHAATTVWRSTDQVNHYNKSQAVKMAQREIAQLFNLKELDVEVQSPFVGGAFGSSSRIWPAEMAAILGAKKTGRPVTVMGKRDQVFTIAGYRPQSVQTIQISAHRDGKIQSITHDALGSTSFYEEFPERITDPTKTLYACQNLKTSYRLAALDMSTPCWTRGPGETSGSFALESAIDELAYALNMDPLTLRLKNFAEKDPESGLPWSTNQLKACYATGADKIGWKNRNPKPGSAQEGNWKKGLGMAAGIYKSTRSVAAAGLIFTPDGKLTIRSSVADVGPGSATVMTQIAADAAAMDMNDIRFDWGKSSSPLAPGQFGSHTTASVGTAIHEVAMAFRKKLSGLASTSTIADFQGKNEDQFVFENGFISNVATGAKMSYRELIQHHKLPEIRLSVETKAPPEEKTVSSKSFCAHFTEVLVHEATGRVRINRVVSAIDAGKVMNRKTATSQVYGSIAWGIGIALMEEGILDHRYGRYVNNNLADYHVPVHADIPDIDVLFIEEPDYHLDPMGAKGLGEIGLVGLSAAIANAIYHATGKRIRSLPVTPDKLI